MNEAAIITKFKAPDAEKPVIRPYTPVSDESVSSCPFQPPKQVIIRPSQVTAASWTSS